MSEQDFLDIHFSFKNSSLCLLPIFVKNAVIDSVIQPQPLESLVNLSSIIFHVGDSGIKEHNTSYNFLLLYMTFSHWILGKLWVEIEFLPNSYPIVASYLLLLL